MLYNFSYVIPGKLAGMARPGISLPLELELEQLKKEGVGAIASLCETPLDNKILEMLSFSYTHIVIHDFTAPTLGQIEKFVAFVSECNRDGVAVAAHCAAGMGRTGTMLACYLVSLGESAEEAIDSVRSIRPGSIETSEQEQAIINYAASLSSAESKR